MRSLETVAKERMEVAVCSITCSGNYPIADEPSDSNNSQSGAKPATRMSRM